MLVVDLTQRLGPDTVMWPGCAAPVFDRAESHGEDGAFRRVVSLSEHSGTHLDAPAHFVAGAATVDQISAERLVCPLAVVDVRDRTADDADYFLSVADLERDEAMNGAIEPGSAVAIHTPAGVGAAATPPGTWGPTTTVRCTSQASDVSPPNGSCVSAWSAASASTPRGSTAALTPRSRSTPK